MLNFESHLVLQGGGVTKSVFGHFLVILSILVSGVGQEGSRGNPRGAQDLILHDLGSFLGPFLNKNRKKTDTTKHSNRYHKRVVWRGYLCLKSGIPQTKGTQFGHGGGEAEGKWILASFDYANIL